MPTAMRLDGLSVLVLEDDFYLAEDTREALQGAGASVLGPFPEPAEALATIGRRPADCAVVDINLGGGPCFEPAEQLIGMGVPVVFVTGYDRSVIPEALAHIPCLHKPAAAHTIVAAVGAACGR